MPKNCSRIRHLLRCAPGWHSRLPGARFTSIRPDPTLAFLGPGERAAIPLALAAHADRLLIDDLAGRTEAKRQRLRVTGTLGVLIEAHWAGLLDFERALAQLRQINFYLSDEAIVLARQELASGERNSGA